MADSTSECDSKKLPARVTVAVRRKRPAIRQGLLDFAASGFLRDYPWRRTGLPPYNVLIAEVTLKRTTATAAERLYRDFLRAFPDLTSLGTASTDELAALLEPIGLQFQRSRALKKMSAYLLEQQGGKIPGELRDLLDVPGIGSYTARAVLSFAFGTPAAVVDSNVKRVYQRVFLSVLAHRTGETLYQNLADCLLEPAEHRRFNLALLDLGALICRPGEPLCHRCPLSHTCDYYQQKPRPKELVNPEIVALAQRVRGARKEIGLSLKELAREAGVSKSTVINLEAGRTRPRQETLEKIADALDMTVYEITGGDSL